jgi:hypothetical protein
MCTAFAVVMTAALMRSTDRLPIILADTGSEVRSGFFRSGRALSITAYFTLANAYNLDVWNCPLPGGLALFCRFFVWLDGVSPFFNRGDGRKQKITVWPILLKRASFFVWFEWPFLRPGLLTGEAPRAGAVKTGRQAPAKRLGLDGPGHGAILAAGMGAFAILAPDFHSLSLTGVMVLSGVSKSCRNMAAGGWRRYVPDAVTREGASNGGSAVA